MRRAVEARAPSGPRAWALGLLITALGLVLARAPELTHLALEAHYWCPMHQQFEHRGHGHAAGTKHGHDDARAQDHARRSPLPAAEATAPGEDDHAACPCVTAWRQQAVAPSSPPAIVAAWLLVGHYDSSGHDTLVLRKALDVAPKRSPPALG